MTSSHPKSAIHSPPVLVYSLVSLCVTYVCNFARIGKWHINASKVHDDGISSVSVLRKIIRPSTIAFAVAAVRVYAIQAMFCGWPRSHVIKKCLKIINPIIAHGYASAAIACVISMFGVIASSLHVLPSKVLRCNISHAAIPMLALPRRYEFRVKAPTALGSPVLSMVGSAHMLISTVTQALKKQPSISTKRTNHTKSTELLHNFLLYCIIPNTLSVGNREAIL